MSIQSRSFVLGMSLCCVALSACSSASDSDGGGAGSGSGGALPAGAGAPNNPSAGSNPAAGSGAGGMGTAGASAVAGASADAGGASPSGAGGSVANGGSVASGGSAGAPSTSACTGNATYRVSLDVTWNDAKVGDKHYTTLIGGVHSGSASFWKLGGMATAGIKAMAEAGGTAPLSDEVQAAIGAGTAKSVIKFGGGNAPGTSNGMLEVSAAFPLVTFGSMLAPTPDWFVGVSSLSLCEAGSWLSEKTLDAVVYDAGTKDGADFDYGFPETKPHAPIGYAVKFPNQLPAGVLKFQKQ